MLSLSVDELGGEPSDPESVRETLDKTGYPFHSGRATRELVEMLQAMHDRLLAMHLPLPVPTSMLIDEQGRLAVIYKGRVSVDRLLDDIDHSSLPLLERFEQSAAVPGRLIRHDLIQGELSEAAWNT